ncbi:MAG: UvrD-helicase domain-containing protein, partial [Fibrobacter sp.]|nr:UvrD-helicase domain-containing protein [Fibrobacter sp.]
MDNSRIKALVSGLNEEQEAAVCADTDRHILILAGAGCGKTTVLTRRIAFLALKGFDQKKILALTFTRKAAMEMDARVKSLDAINCGTALPLITTFHGFALRILSEFIDGKRNFERIGLCGTPSLLEENNRIELLVKICPLKERKVLMSDIFQIDSLLAQKAVFPEKIAGLGEQKLQLLQDIECRLKNEKHKTGKWDFSDLLTGVLELFDKNQHLISEYSSRFDAVLVDEFQDTNPMQIKVLHRILAGKTSLFAVGDDDQAIYGFRGADIRPTMEFCSFFPGAKIHKLQMNYRSVPAILNSANKLFVNKDPRYRKKLVSGRYKEPGTKPSVHIFEDQSQMIDWVINRSRMHSEKEGIACEKNVMLFRVNQSLEWTSDFIKQQHGDSGTDLQFLTVHRSKGLEFPVVFLCDLEEGIFPSYQIPARKKIGS